MKLRVKASEQAILLIKAPNCKGAKGKAPQEPGPGYYYENDNIDNKPIIMGIADPKGSTIEQMEKSMEKEFRKIYREGLWRSNCEALWDKTR